MISNTPNLPASLGPVEVGWPVDWLLARRGAPTKIEQLGRDKDGYVVEYYYPDAIYKIAYAKGHDLALGELGWYCIQEIRPLEAANGTK